MSAGDSDFGSGFWCGTVVWFIISFVFIAAMSQCHIDEKIEMKSKAVELGAAEWRVNPKTGSTTFTWKEKPAEKP